MAHGGNPSPRLLLTVAERPEHRVATQRDGNAVRQPFAIMHSESVVGVLVGAAAVRGNGSNGYHHPHGVSTSEIETEEQVICDPATAQALRMCRADTHNAAEKQAGAPQTEHQAAHGR